MKLRRKPSEKPEWFAYCFGCGQEIKRGGLTAHVASCPRCLKPLHVIESFHDPQGSAPN